MNSVMSGQVLRGLSLYCALRPLRICIAMCHDYLYHDK